MILDKLIGISPGKSDQLNRYTAWLDHCGLRYRVLDDDEDLAEDIQVLLLCGGPDIGLDVKRDKLERHRLMLAWGRIPVLGICRGLQLVNVLLGGGLIEDLVESGLYTSHTSTDGNSHWHNVTWYHPIGELTAQRFLVNSRHHQAISCLGEDLVPVAYSEDGVIEAVIGKSFLGVQWHPERDEIWGTIANEIVENWLKGGWE